MVGMYLSGLVEILGLGYRYSRVLVSVLCPECCLDTATDLQLDKIGILFKLKVFRQGWESKMGIRPRVYMSSMALTSEQNIDNQD